MGITKMIVDEISTDTFYRDILYLMVVDFDQSGAYEYADYSGAGRQSHSVFLLLEALRGKTYCA
ncbi:MAG: hypothetical protein ACOX62_02155 [Christensenellales bacterium]